MNKGMSTKNPVGYIKDNIDSNGSSSSVRAQNNYSYH
jgi:hypothetical protein